MYTLYARAGAGSAAVEALLSELGVAHELINVAKEPDGSPPAWFRAINPRGEIPALKLPDGAVMAESAAMMIDLADRHPAAGLAPAIGSPERSQYLRWMVYGASAIYTSDLRGYYPARYSTDPGHAAAIKAKAVADTARDIGDFADALGNRVHILGDAFSAADIYMAMLISWDFDLAALFAARPRLKAYYDRIAARPAIRPVWDRNEMP
jgi:glutathione S-transferase